MSPGKIVAGALAPHPPHIVYAENPPQNEPKAECGWETIRWAYHGLQRSLAAKDYDVIVVLTPHWQTYVGTHVLAVPERSGLSVDPIFPNLFRFHYDMKIDVALAQAIYEEGKAHDLEMKLMQNPDFRVDYGTIISCHMANPKWDKPIVAISSNRSTQYYNADYMQGLAIQLGEATRAAIEKSGKRAILLASNSLSHRHFTTEPPVPEDMSHEHIYNHNQYLWDMRMIELMRAGEAQTILDLMPDFTEQTMGETDSGALTWLLSALGRPTYPAHVYGYGTVIGTGNAVVEWDAENNSPSGGSARRSSKGPTAQGGI